MSDPIRLRPRYVRSPDELREDVKEALRAIERLAEDLGEWESDEHALHTVEIARTALRSLVDVKPTSASREIVGRLYAALLNNPSRKHPGRPWYTVPELAEMFGLSRWAMKRWIVDNNIPHAPQPGRRNYRVLVEDLEKYPEWQGTKKFRSYVRREGPRAPFKGHHRIVSPSAAG